MKKLHAFIVRVGGTGNITKLDAFILGTMGNIGTICLALFIMLFGGWITNTIIGLIVLVCISTTAQHEWIKRSERARYHEQLSARMRRAQAEAAKTAAQQRIIDDMIDDFVRRELASRRRHEPARIVPPFFKVLSLDPSRVPSVAEVTTAYRRAASKVHPDRGGTDAQMQAVNTARRDALAFIKLQQFGS